MIVYMISLGFPKHLCVLPQFKTMKYAMFGDSYAVYHDSGKAWSNVINERLAGKKLHNLAISGTSHWYSYTKFIENFRNFDCVIFCHTNSMRWPVLPPGEHGRAWNIGYLECPVMDPYNKIRKDILSEELLNFISYNIFQDVNKLCQENNIYLINILSFPLDFKLPKTPYPVLVDLNQISTNEQVIYDGKLKYVCDLNGILKRGDKRACHLNFLNNNKLAEIVTDLIKNKTYDYYVDLKEQYEWNYHDPALDKIYELEYKYEKSLSDRLLGLYRKSPL